MARVLVLSRRNITHPRAGGASRYIHEIFRRLAKSHDITILSEGQQNCDPVQEIDGLTYVNAIGKLLRVQIPLNYLVRFARKTDVLIDNADVAIPWFTPVFSRKPIITIIHQFVREIFYEELPRPLATIGYVSEPALYSLYARSTIVAMSGSTAQCLRDAGIPEKKIRIIGPGCPFPGMNRTPLAERSQNLIGCVSRLMRYKGVQFILKAISEISKQIPDVRLEIAGSGPCESELRKMASDLGLSSKVSFLGRVTEQRKLSLYRECRVAVLSSIREGYGLSIVEANAVGTPAVGWNVAGLMDSIISGQTGLLARFPDQHDLNEKIRRLLVDDASWNEMSENAWKWSNDHSWDRSAQLFDETIDSVMD